MAFPLKKELHYTLKIQKWCNLLCNIITVKAGQ